MHLSTDYGKDFALSTSEILFRFTLINARVSEPSLVPIFRGTSFRHSNRIQTIKDEHGKTWPGDSVCLNFVDSHCAHALWDLSLILAHVVPCLVAICSCYAKCVATRSFLPVWWTHRTECVVPRVRTKSLSDRSPALCLLVFF